MPLRMAQFETHAEILTPEHSLMKMYETGFKKTPPGMMLKDILEHTHGVYEVDVEIPPRMREDLRRVAELTSDRRLLAISEGPAVRTSLEHLRGVPPETRVSVGCSLTYGPGEAERLGLRRQGPPDPRTTFAGGDER